MDDEGDDAGVTVHVPDDAEVERWTAARFEGEGDELVVLRRALMGRLLEIGVEQRTARLARRTLH